MDTLLELDAPEAQRRPDRGCQPFGQIAARIVSDLVERRPPPEPRTQAPGQARQIAD